MADPQVVEGVHGNAAAKYRLITSDPCAVVDKSTVPKVERTYLLPGHVRKLATILDDAAPYGLILRFAAFTGLREGELAALRIGDVSLMHKRLYVRHTVPLPA